MLGFVGEPVIAELLRPVLRWLPGVEVEPGSGISVVVALAVATVVQMVAGELVPKSWAIAKPLGTAKIVVWPFSAFAYLFGWLITVLNEAANVVVRLLGVEPREELSAVRSLDELELLVRSSVQEGTLDASTYPLITRAISFTGKTAARALVPRTSVVSLTPEASVADLVATSVRTGHSRFPVGPDLDDVVGAVLVKDAAGIPRNEWDRTSVADLVVDVPVVPESRDLASLFSEMRVGGHHLAVVVDEHGGTEGIITTEDVLEQIVGEIEDEYDPARPTAARWAGDYVVTGMLHAEQLAEETDFELPAGDFDTLAGFLLAEMGHLPRAGERVTHDGWVFEIVSMDGRRIDRVRVTPPGRRRETEREGRE